MPIDTRGREGTRHVASIGHLRILKETKEQWTRNDLEVDLLVQLNYSCRVADICMQPLLEVDGKHFKASASFSLYAGVTGPSGHLVEIEQGRDQAAENAPLGRRWCAERGFAFHLIDISILNTKALEAARLLTPYVGTWPLEEDVGSLVAAITATGGRTTVDAAEAALMRKGVEAGIATDVVRQAVANNFVRADPEGGYVNATMLENVGLEDFSDPGMDAFLRLLPGLRGS